MNRDWVELAAYGPPSQSFPHGDLPPDGIRHEYSSTPIAVIPGAVRGVHAHQFRIGWENMDANRQRSRGGRVAATPVDIDLPALELSDGLAFGRHVWLIGTRNEILTRLFGPQRTGFRLRADAGAVIGGLRPGVHSILAAGDVVDLDPVVLAGSEWTITGDAEHRIHVERDNPTIALQRHTGEGWQDVSTTLSVAITASGVRLRVRPSE